LTIYIISLKNTIYEISMLTRCIINTPSKVIAEPITKNKDMCSPRNIIENKTVSSGEIFESVVSLLTAILRKA